MNYIDFTVGDTNYKLRLNTRTTILLEKKLNGNPLKVFTELKDKNDIPTIETMVTVLHCALQAYHSNITLDDTFDIFDRWLEDEHITSEFLAIIVELYKVSGLIQKDKERKN